MVSSLLLATIKLRESGYMALLYRHETFISIPGSSSLNFTTEVSQHVRTQIQIPFEDQIIGTSGWEQGVELPTQ